MPKTGKSKLVRDPAKRYNPILTKRGKEGKIMGKFPSNINDADQSARFNPKVR